MNLEQTFAEALKHPRMGSSAWDEWRRYRGDRTDETALIDLMIIHLRHIEDLRAQGKAAREDNAIFLTEIPDYDLAVLDAYFPSIGERQVHVFSKAGANAALYSMVRSFKLKQPHE